MTGIVKTDQIQGAQSSTITIPGSNNLVIGGNLTVDTSTLYVDSTNNRVGVGTVSPESGLHLFDGTNVNTPQNSNRTSTLIIEGGSQTADLQFLTSANYSHIFFGDAVDANVGVLLYDHTNNSMQFTTNTSEAMRIDSSGNLLVGGTNSIPGAGNTAVGASIYNDGRIFLSKSANTVASFNRNTSDGGIAEFRKDGATVGSIGTASSDLTIFSSTGNHKGLRFGNGQIVPTNNAGADSDNTTDLGGTSNRFKNLYLSSGVYLGGTGSANKLHDYEEGTWTAVLTGSSSNPSSTVQTTGARYTKVGRFVFAQALFSNVNTSGASGAPRVTGLPFSAATSYATGNVMLHTGFNVGGGVVNVSPFVTTTQVQFYQSISASAWGEIAHNATSGVYLYFTVTYETT